MAIPKLQLLSRTQYDTDGFTTIWDFNFSGGYILSDHIKAYYDTPEGVRTVVTVGPAMLIGPYQLQITPPIPAGNVLTIYRATPKDQPLVDFVDRGTVSEVALDTVARQAIFVAAEASDDTVTANSDVAVNAAIDAQTSKAAAAISASEAAASATSAALAATNAATAATTAVNAHKLDIAKSARISVKDHGALGNGVANDLPAIEAARDYAASVGKTLYFPDGAYGVNDRFMFADGGNAYFELGAYIKLLQPTTSGGVTSGPFPVQTKPLTVHNLTVDCNNIAGENAGGFGHKVGMKLINYTARNVKHSPTIFGGKALQFEGAETTNVQVIGVNLENCSIGLDFGAVPTEQSVQILVSDVAMTRVDTPIYVNDTNVAAASDNYDQMDIVVNNVNLRNCGKLTHSGAVSTAGGLIVSDRGYKIVVNGLKAVNDRGGFTSTAYGGIGALVRGQGKGIVINNAIIDADMVALFDHNPAGLQSPFAGDIASYVLAENVRHYGNLDYVVKCMPGGGKLGAGRLKGIEIDSTQASLAGIVDPNAGAYNNTLLEVVDRGNKFLSTGLITLDKHLALGNALNGGTVGYPAPSQLEGPWTPVDGSGAGLAFTAATGWWFRVGNLVTVFFQVTYPTTANGASASIGGLPYPIRDTLYARAGGTLTVSTVATAKRLYPANGTTTVPVLSETAGAVTNATLSGATLAGTVTYPVL